MPPARWKSATTWSVRIRPASCFHWQAIHRGAFYRGGPIKTAISSGIDQALWDITGKIYGVPVYRLLGGPTRDRVRVYGTLSEKTGVNAMKVRLRGNHAVALQVQRRPEIRRRSGRAFQGAAHQGRLRRRHRRRVPRRGPAADRDGLMKALEPYSPWFYEEIVQALNVDVMAELAKKTHIPIATGERIFTKWGFKEILEKRAAMILQPDVCYAGGITELKIIAGMAEAYYSPLAPHNPQGPCSLAASLQIAASIPNFLIQERGDNEYTDLLAKPLPPVTNGHRPLLTEPGPRHHDRREQADGAGRRAADPIERSSTPTTARSSTGNKSPVKRPRLLTTRPSQIP